MDLLSGHGDADELSLDPPDSAETAWTPACIDEEGRRWTVKIETTISDLGSQAEGPRESG